MRPLRGLASAWDAIRLAPLSHLVASLTVGATLFAALGAGTLALGVRSLLASWGSRVELTLYLSDELGEAEGRRLSEQAAETIGGSARWVSPLEAMARLRDALGDQDGTLLDLPENPLPASIELRPGAAVGAEQLPHLAAVLGRLPGVDEVDWGRGWADRLGKLSRMAEGGLFGIILVLLGGTSLLVGGVVRFAIHARREEIDVLRLLGASGGFIRLPFLLEGILAGAVGGSFAAIGFHLAAGWEGRLAATLPLPHELSIAPLAGWAGSLSVVALGALLGLLATIFALARELK